MTDKERIEKINEILKEIKENGSSKCENVYENNASIGVLYYSSVDIKSLKSLKRKLMAFQNMDKLHQIKTVIGKFTDDRPDCCKPKKAVLKYIDLDFIY